MNKLKIRIVRQLLQWYAENKRDLPWRNTRNIYYIWLSEVILQQTRVIQGLPYFNKFLLHFPDIQSLANAQESEVLRLWQGLGYYSRARNLHACAKNIAFERQGVWPESYENLQELKGVGKYTAAAIASFAYLEPVPVIDGNAYRVWSRFWGDFTDISSAAAFKHFFALATELIPSDKPDIFNQAVMELGATVCTPKRPLCHICPLAFACVAREKNIAEQLPVKTKKVKVSTRYFYYFLLLSNGKVYMKERLLKDIWSGLYDFPMAESKHAIDTVSALEELKIFTEHSVINLDIEEESKIYKHILTHQRIFAKFISIKINEKAAWHAHMESSGYKLYSIEAIKALPKPILIHNYLNDNLF